MTKTTTAAAGVTTRRRSAGAATHVAAAATTAASGAIARAAADDRDSASPPPVAAVRVRTSRRSAQRQAEAATSGDDADHSHRPGDDATPVAEATGQEEEEVAANDVEMADAAAGADDADALLIEQKEQKEDKTDDDRMDDVSATPRHDLRDTASHRAVLAESERLTAQLARYDAAHQQGIRDQEAKRVTTAARRSPVQRATVPQAEFKRAVAPKSTPVPKATPVTTANLVPLPLSHQPAARAHRASTRKVITRVEGRAATFDVIHSSEAFRSANAAHHFTAFEQELLFGRIAEKYRDHYNAGYDDDFIHHCVTHIYFNFGLRDLLRRRAEQAETEAFLAREQGSPRTPHTGDARFQRISSEPPRAASPRQTQTAYAPEFQFGRSASPPAPAAAAHRPSQQRGPKHTPAGVHNPHGLPAPGPIRVNKATLRWAPRLVVPTTAPTDSPPPPTAGWIDARYYLSLESAYKRWLNLRVLHGITEPTKAEHFLDLALESLQYMSRSPVDNTPAAAGTGTALTGADLLGYLTSDYPPKPVRDQDLALPSMRGARIWRSRTPKEPFNSANEVFVPHVVLDNRRIRVSMPVFVSFLNHFEDFMAAYPHPAHMRAIGLCEELNIDFGEEHTADVNRLIQQRDRIVDLAIAQSLVAAVHTISLAAGCYRDIPSAERQSTLFAPLFVDYTTAYIAADAHHNKEANNAFSMFQALVDHAVQIPDEVRRIMEESRTHLPYLSPLQATYAEQMSRLSPNNARRAGYETHASTAPTVHRDAARLAAHAVDERRFVLEQQALLDAHPEELAARQEHKSVPTTGRRKLIRPPATTAAPTLTAPAPLTATIRATAASAPTLTEEERRLDRKRRREAKKEKKERRDGKDDESNQKRSKKSPQPEGSCIYTDPDSSDDDIKVEHSTRYPTKPSPALIKAAKRIYGHRPRFVATTPTSSEPSASPSPPAPAAMDIAAFLPDPSVHGRPKDAKKPKGPNQKGYYKIGKPYILCPRWSTQLPRTIGLTQVMAVFDSKDKPMPPLSTNGVKHYCRKNGYTHQFFPDFPVGGAEGANAPKITHASKLGRRSLRRHGRAAQHTGSPDSDHSDDPSASSDESSDPSSSDSSTDASDSFSGSTRSSDSNASGRRRKRQARHSKSRDRSPKRGKSSRPQAAFNSHSSFKVDPRLYDPNTITPEHHLQDFNDALKLRQTDISQYHAAFVMTLPEGSVKQHIRALTRNNREKHIDHFARVVAEFLREYRMSETELNNHKNRLHDIAKGATEPIGEFCDRFQSAYQLSHPNATLLTQDLSEKKRIFISALEDDVKRAIALRLEIAASIPGVAQSWTTFTGMVKGLYTMRPPTEAHQAARATHARHVAKQRIDSQFNATDALLAPASSGRHMSTAHLSHHKRKDADPRDVFSTPAADMAILHSRSTAAGGHQDDAANDNSRNGRKRNRDNRSRNLRNDQQSPPPPPREASAQQDTTPPVSNRHLRQYKGRDNRQNNYQRNQQAPSHANAVTPATGTNQTPLGGGGERILNPTFPARTYNSNRGSTIRMPPQGQRGGPCTGWKGACGAPDHSKEYCPRNPDAPNFNSHVRNQTGPRPATYNKDRPDLMEAPLQKHIDEFQRKQALNTISANVVDLASDADDDHATTSDPIIHVPISMPGVNSTALVDTGAARNLMSHAMYQQLNPLPALTATRFSGKGFNGAITRALGTISIPVGLLDVKRNLTYTKTILLYVMPTLTTPVILCMRGLSHGIAGVNFDKETPIWRGQDKIPDGMQPITPDELKQQTFTRPSSW